MTPRNRSSFDGLAPGLVAVALAILAALVWDAFTATPAAAEVLVTRSQSTVVAEGPRTSRVGDVPATPATSAPFRSTWHRGQASAYGPGLYGNRTACGQTLRPTTRGVAHRTLPCGTRLRICRSGRCTHARVIDRGPFSGSRVLDLTAATTRELCGCGVYAWGVRTVAYRRAAL